MESQLVNNLKEELDREKRAHRRTREALDRAECALDELHPKHIQLRDSLIILMEWVDALGAPFNTDETFQRHKAQILESMKA